VTAPAAPSPYTAGATPGTSPDHSYSTANPWSGDGYSDSPIGAYAPPPSVDPDRLELRTRVDSRANLRDVFGWWKRKNADVNQRESVTEQNAVGWTERKSAPRGVADRPKPSATGEPRSTLSMSPGNYQFERPFDARIARTFDGQTTGALTTFTVWRLPRARVTRTALSLVLLTVILRICLLTRTTRLSMRRLPTFPFLQLRGVGVCE